MSTHEFSKITDAERSAFGVSALSNRPNETGLYGVGGLSAQQLKEWFDKFANFLADKFNDLCDIFKGANGADVAQYIKLPNFGSYETLRDVLNGIEDGTFADTMMAYASASAEEASSLQSIINGMAATLSIVITTSNYTSYIVDALNSDDATKALSAKQGKALKTDVDLKIAIASIVDNLTTNDATKVLSAKQGKALKDLVDTLSSTSASSYGTTIDFSLNPSTYVLTIKLKNASGTVLSTATVDLPLEILKIGASYANGVLTLNIKTSDDSLDNTPIEIDISDLISGLVNSDDIADNLTTDDATKVLSAKQGKKLNDEKIDKTSIADDLITDDATKVLSAKQGKKLSDEKIDKTSIVDNLTTDDATKVLSAKQGKALKTNMDAKITDDRLRIANIENSLYDFILAKGTENFTALKNAILPSGITVDETLYPIADGANGILSTVKGNTKQFNQLVQNGNFESTSGWTNSSNISFLVSSNVCTITYLTTGAGYGYALFMDQQYRPEHIIGHKYLITCKVRPNVTRKYTFDFDNRVVGTTDCTADVWTAVSAIVVAENNNNNAYFARPYGTVNINDTCDLKEAQIFDLTAMGLDSITTVEEFTTLYPKPYYARNAGTLYDSVISGVSLTGRNLFDKSVTHIKAYIDTNGVWRQDTDSKSWRLAVSEGKEYIVYENNINETIFRVGFASTDTIPVAQTQVPLSSVERYSGAVKTSLIAPAGAKWLVIQCSNANYSTTIQTLVVSDTVREISLPSAQTLGGVGDMQDTVSVTRNTDNDYYTIKKYVRKQQGALSAIPQWNQRISNSIIPETTTVRGITFTKNNDGSITVTGDNDGTGVSSVSILITTVANHWYLLKGCPKNGSKETYYMHITSTAAGLSLEDIGDGVVEKCTNWAGFVGQGNIIIRIASGQTGVNLTFKPQFIDLTAIFGAGNEPVTITDVPYWIKDKDYFAYKVIGSGVDTSVTHNYLYNNDDDVAWTGAATETTITTTATLAEVSAIRENGGMISVVGNDNNEDYAQPDVSEIVTYEKADLTGGE